MIDFSWIEDPVKAANIIGDVKETNNLAHPIRETEDAIFKATREHYRIGVREGLRDYQADIKFHRYFCII